jgi:hypothetical protein
MRLKIGVTHVSGVNDSLNSLSMCIYCFKYVYYVYITTNIVEG